MSKFEYAMIEDREWFQPVLTVSGKMGSENAFGTLLIWNESHHSCICRQDEYVLLSSGKHFHTYNFPYVADSISAGSPRDALQLLIDDAAEKGPRFQIWGMTEREVARTEEAMPGCSEFSIDRDDADYIYNSSDLIELVGRKYHGKRNHVSRFNRQHQWEYEDVTVDALDACHEVSCEWCRQNGCDPENGLDKEVHTLRKAFTNLEELKPSDGLTRIDGKPVAYAIGEEINPQIFLLHFEKALADYGGLYTATNNEFARRNLSGYQYINKEEDLGLEGLHKARLSYYPVIILEKYRAVLKGTE